MKSVGFIGGYDKIDLLLYIARILVLGKKRVLLVDTTVSQKARYVVPVINPTMSYVTEFEGIDVAVGFDSMESIKEYLGIGSRDLPYDIALIDVDSPDAAISFNIAKNEKNCFVTAFDMYSLKKGIEVLRAFDEPVKLTKVLFSKSFLKEENEYLDYISLGYKVKWEKNMINFPLELGNYSVSVENQIISRIKVKRLSEHYKESLMYLIQIIFSNEISSRRSEKNHEISRKGIIEVMSVITFWNNNTGKIGQTYSAIAISAFMAVEHNYKILLISTGCNDQVAMTAFGANTRSKAIKLIANDMKGRNIRSRIWIRGDGKTCSGK